MVWVSLIGVKIKFLKGSWFYFSLCLLNLQSKFFLLCFVIRDLVTVALAFKDLVCIFWERFFALGSSVGYLVPRYLVLLLGKTSNFMFSLCFFLLNLL